MKIHMLPRAMAVILGLSSMASHAVLLLSDDFTVTTPMSGNGVSATAAEAAANNNLANRQSGLYAGSPYTWAGTTGRYNVQTGNTATSLYPGPTVLTDGNYLLFQATGVQNNLALNFDLAGDHAIAISFDMYASTNGGWGAFTLSSILGGTTTPGGAAYPANANVLFGFLTAYNGSFEAWNAATKYYSNGSAFASYDSPSWTVVLSDVVGGVAGTGSPFGGNGTFVSIYYNGTLIDGRALSTEFGDSTLYLGFTARYTTTLGTIGIDNLSVTAVPEPSSVGYIVAAGMGLVVFVARRRMVRG